jgi:DNA-binding response OmpR family regulator
MLSTARPPPLVLMIYGVDTEGYADFFVASGFRLAESRDAADGLAQAIALVPDLIVLDFGYDGETVASLRGNPITSAIPIIALTDICRLGACGAKV